MDASGAGLAMLRLHKALLSSGCSSKVLVASKTSDLETVYVAQPNFNFFKFSSNRIVRFFQKKKIKNIGFSNQVEKYEKMVYAIPEEHQTGMFTFPVTHYDISEHPLVKEADIIHLHWISNFVDYESFFKKVNKPIVWTFHDLNPLMGGFHYPYYKQNYNSYYQNIEDDFVSIKQTSLNDKSNIALVAISEDIKIEISKSKIFNQNIVYSISNSVDGEKFKLLDKISCKKSLGLDNYKYVILFVSDYLNNPVKGLNILVEVLELFASKDIALLCVGSGVAPKSSAFDIIHFSSINQERLLSIFYSAADVFTMTSIEEAFGQTTIEAMACGTPVVAFPVGIAKEIINDSNGVICKGKSVNALGEGLKKCIANNYDPMVIRKQVVDKFNAEKIANEYVSFYTDVLKNNQ